MDSKVWERRLSETRSDSGERGDSVVLPPTQQMLLLPPLMSTSLESEKAVGVTMIEGKGANIRIKGRKRPLSCGELRRMAAGVERRGRRTEDQGGKELGRSWEIGEVLATGMTFAKEEEEKPSVGVAVKRESVCEGNDDWNWTRTQKKLEAVVGAYPSWELGKKSVDHSDQ